MTSWVRDRLNRAFSPRSGGDGDGGDPPGIGGSDGEGSPTGEPGHSHGAFSELSNGPPADASPVPQGHPVYPPPGTVVPVAHQTPPTHQRRPSLGSLGDCLLYTSDAADE